MNTLNINKITIPLSSGYMISTGETVNQSDEVNNSTIVGIDQDRKPIAGKIYKENANTERSERLSIQDSTGKTTWLLPENKVLAKNGTGITFIEAQDLQPGDTVFGINGWAFNPMREEVLWKFGKNFSPYLYGLLWGLKEISHADWLNDKSIDIPVFASEELLFELHSIGFAINEKEQTIDLYSGLSRIAKRNKMLINEVVDYLATDTLITQMIEAPEMAQRGFIAGLQELFRNNKISETDEEFIIPLSAEQNEYLYTIYTNLGEPIQINDYNNIQYLLVKRQNRHNVVYAQGLVAREVQTIQHVPGRIEVVDIITSNNAIMAGNLLVK